MVRQLAALMSATEKAHVLSSLRFERFTPHTITSLSRLRKELDRTKQRGYALDDEEATLGARCVGAPVLLEGGRVAAAISVAGPITRIVRERIPVYANAVLASARSISRHLGTAETSRTDSG